MSVNRLTGLTTGMDTDQLVKDLMKIEQAKYDKVDIKKQYTEWQQEAYRTTISTIDEFQSKYFDVLNQENYLMSISSFSAFSSTTLVNGEEEDYVTVTGTADATSLNHTIESVDNLATTDKWHSAVSSIASVNSVAITLEKLNAIKDAGGSLDLSIDGSTKTITFTGEEFDEIDGVAGDELTIDDLVDVLNDKIEAAFGSGYSDVVGTITDGVDDFIQFDQPGSTVGVYKSSDSSLLSQLGISSGITNESYETRSINVLFGITDEKLNDFSINGVKISNLASSDTVEEFAEKINAANTGVKLTFNAKSNRFLLESNKTGAVNNIDFSDSEDANFVFAALGFADVAGDGTTSAAYRESGENAIVNIDGETIVKAENSFELEGVRYTLNKEYTGVGIDPIEITLKNNTDEIADKIKGFVEDYNTLIAVLHGIVGEEKNDDYKPLTDEQRSSLSEDQIEDWETEAKKGILRRESNITKMLDEMRTAFYESVEGSNISLADIGITTSSNYKDRGKLVVDDEKLLNALENDFDGVVTLFTQESDNPYLEKGTSSERYAENGLMQRLDDIISNQIRTTRDTDGNKGYLIEKAGVTGDSSVVNNTLSKQLLAYDDRLETILDLLSDKEERYYLEFASMESALAQLQNQAASLTSTLGG